MTELEGGISRGSARSAISPVIPSVPDREVPQKVKNISKEHQAKINELWEQTSSVTNQIIRNKEAYVKDFPFIVNGKGVLVYGDSENGKTAVLRWAIRNFLRDKPNGAVFLITENADTTDEQMHSIMAGVDAPNWIKRIRHTDGDYYDFEDIINQMKIVCEKLTANGHTDIIIIVDTITHALGECCIKQINFDKRQEIAPYLGKCKKLAASLNKEGIGCVIIQVHHTNNPIKKNSPSEIRPSNSRGWFSQNKVRAKVYKTGDIINVESSGQDFGKKQLIGYQIKDNLTDYLIVEAKESADDEVILTLHALACFYIATFKGMKMNRSQLQLMMGKSPSIIDKIITRLIKDEYLPRKSEYGKLELQNEHRHDSIKTKGQVDKYIADLCEPYGLEPFTFRLQKRDTKSKKTTYRVHFS